ncbi:uncharacterized protein LOC131690504 [Topomyia yanbarensis]|uniref:uncharacterized protein LOC131690504 n=1 Tax=Topomyia yanbarensis TaxID=2498891 RepID=UPI00273A860B|nr:uncharacterized protein LOC131690504 [Topomyia yanbarensis]
MFKIMCLLVIIAVASVSARPNPKPDIITYSAPVVVADPDVVVTSDFDVPVAVYEQTFHGSVAPLIAAYSTPYLTAPLAYSPYESVVALAPGTVLLK